MIRHNLPLHNLDIDLSGFFDQQIFKMCLHIAADIRCYTRLSLIWSISFCSSSHLNTTVDICHILAFVPCFSTWAFPLSVVKSANHWNQMFFAIISITVFAKSISPVGCHSDRWYFKFPSFIASMNLLYLSSYFFIFHLPFSQRSHSGDMMEIDMTGV